MVCRSVHIFQFRDDPNQNNFATNAWRRSGKERSPSPETMPIQAWHRRIEGDTAIPKVDRVAAKKAAVSTSCQRGGLASGEQGLQDAIYGTFGDARGG